MKAHIHAKLPEEQIGWVHGPEFGDGAPQSCAIIGISCYPGCQLTFWIRGVGRWLYCDVPAHYLGLQLAGAGRQPESRQVRVPAKSTGFVVDGPLDAEAPIGGVKHVEIAMVDFLEQNELLWVLARPSDGAIIVSSHRYFDAARPEGGLRKMRQTWT